MLFVLEKLIGPDDDRSLVFEDILFGISSELYDQSSDESEFLNSSPEDKLNNTTTTIVFSHNSLYVHDIYTLYLF